MVHEPWLGDQVGALAVWLFACEFWAVFVGALVARSVSGDSRGAKGAGIVRDGVMWLYVWERFASLVQFSAGIALSQLVLVFARHQTTTSRKRVYSRAVTVLRGALRPLVWHVLHGIFGVVSVRYFIRLLPGAGELANQLDAVGFCNGFLFSVIYFVCGRNEIRFNGWLQTRRLGRVQRAMGRAFKGSVYSSFFLWLVLRVLDFLLPASVQVFFTSVPRFAPFVLISWPVQLWFCVGAELYYVLATETKRIGLSSRFPVSNVEEARMLANALKVCDPGSVESALMSLPLMAADSTDEAKLFGSSGVIGGSEQYGNLLIRAKAQELLTSRRGSSSSVEESSTDCDQPSLSLVTHAEAALRQWWAEACQAAASREKQVAASGDPLARLRQRRLDAVTQAVYALDSVFPGAAFTQRGRLSGTQSLVRLRAFADLASMAELSASRRQALVGDRRAWLQTLESCLAVVDAQTLVLSVACRDAAHAPTPPVRTRTGESLVDALVLGPCPTEQPGPREAEVRAAEQAARLLRRQAWFSAEWWRSIALSQFQEHDPVAYQLMLQREDLRLRQERKRITDEASAMATPTAFGAASEKLRLSWEQRWRFQQKQHSQSWLRTLLDVIQRTASERSGAILADSQVVMCAVSALGNLASSSAQGPGADPNGSVADAVPLILESLIGCLRAIEEYVKSPTFLGSVDLATSKLDVNHVARREVLALQFVLERAVYSMCEAFKKSLSSYSFPVKVAQTLERYATSR